MDNVAIPSVEPWELHTKTQLLTRYYRKTAIIGNRLRVIRAYIMSQMCLNLYMTTGSCKQNRENHT